MVKKKPQTLQELFKKAAKSSSRLTVDDQEDRELQKALELSRKEQVNEQRRLLEQFSRSSQPTKTKSNPKRRLIQRESEKEDSDDDFLSTDHRPQISQKDKAKQVKQEKAEEPLLEIADLSAFLNGSDTEEEEDQDSVVNLSDFPREASLPTVLIDDDDDTNEIPFANERLEWQGEVEDATVISDSDCSIIDLVNPDNSSKSSNLLPEEQGEEDGDDGYLSPLEGFTNLKDNRDNALFNPFFEQLQQKTTKRKRKTTSTTTKKKPAYRGKWYYVNKKKRKKN